MSADLKVTGCQECFTAALVKLHWNVGDKIFSAEERDEAMLGREGGGEGWGGYSVNTAQWEMLRLPRSEPL